MRFTITSSLWLFIQVLNSIPGPPLTPQDFVSYLISQGIEVGIMPQGYGTKDMDGWAAQNLRFDAGWVCDSKSRIL